MDQAILDEIVEECEKLQRMKRRGVYPRDLVYVAGIPVVEFTARRYCNRLWREGRLVRIGGAGSRKGYRVPTPLEREYYRLVGALPGWVQ